MTDPQDHTPPAPADEASAPTPAPGNESTESITAPSEATPPPAPEPVADPEAPAPLVDEPAPVVADDTPVGQPEAPPSDTSDKARGLPSPGAPDTEAPAPDAPPATPTPAHPVRLGTIAGVKDNQVRVDFFAAGVKEVGLCPAELFKKIPRVGEHIEFLIESTDDGGTLRLARPPQIERIGWKSIHRGDELDVQVTGMNTGGLEVKIPHTKVRGFMPLSQIDLTAPEADQLTPFLGKTLHVRATEVNAKKKRLVVSRRALLEGAAKAEALKNISVGDELEGKVRTLAQFGVFVEVAPGVDGLVRMGDLAWHHVPTAEDVCKVDDVVKVKVVQIDTKAGKLGLSIKALLPNPWKELETKYPVGSKQKGTVVKTTDFGAFVELEPGVEGMIHISQLSDRRIEKVEHAVKVGHTVEFKVREIDPKRRRISLSIRALTAPENDRAGEASRSEIRQFTTKEKDAHAMESLMAKFGEDGLKGGIG